MHHSAGPLSPGERRGDLDALRGFAMLLGIALHAALSFFGSVWPVHDERQSGLLVLLFAVVHGFRMPLFFLLSGFFTMLVFSRRGLEALVRQRAARILLPLVVSVPAILPICEWLIDRGVRSTPLDPTVRSILAGDAPGVRAALDAGRDPNGRDPVFRRPLLIWAVMAGETDIAETLCQAGADANLAEPSGSSPLHMAALCGRDACVASLLARGADPLARAAGGSIPIESTVRSPTFAASVAEFSGGIDLPVDAIAAGRAGVRSRLEPVSTDPRRDGVAGVLTQVANRYWAFLASDRFLLDLGPFGRLHLFDTHLFEHLWFLWYLCWLVAVFAALAWLGLAPSGRWQGWLVPASFACQALMAPPHSQLFGPDVATGLLPPPHLLGSYACFYFFGAAAFARGGTASRLGSWWPLLLAGGLLGLFPLSIALLANRPASVLLQPAYAWALSLGLIGLFRRCCPRPSPGVAWLSDASYWMYLAHLPLVLAGQLIVQSWPLPALVKFGLLMVVVTALLLVSYRWCVRDTFIGRALNGRRSGAPRASAGGSTGRQGPPGSPHASAGPLGARRHV